MTLKILKTTKVRDINPFGFIVEQYQADPEADQIPTIVSGSTTVSAFADALAVEIPNIVYSIERQYCHEYP